MDREGTRTRRAALFVDFENVYIGLRTVSPEAAERFATDPATWVQWMEQGLGPFRIDDDERPRALLRRICYLDPRSSGRYRPYFTRAGFRVVDCPALTAKGKNSADINMVLDIIDTLGHVTRFDDFIVLSADADFTPVLLRLREHDRCTAILANGPTAAALRAACDFVIPETMFVEEALGVDDGGLGESPDEQPAVPVGAAGRQHHDALRERMERVIRDLLAASECPVDMATAAHAVRKALGGTAALDNWAGAGSFKQFLATIQDERLAMDPTQPGWIRDPTRHGPVTDTITSAVEVPEVAHRVSRVVGAPLLDSPTYGALFEMIAEESRSRAPTSLARAERSIRDRCAQRGHPVNRQSVHFVLLGLQYSGVEWRGAGYPAGYLAAEFAENVLRLTTMAEMDLAEAERREIREWIAGSRAEPVVTPPGPSAAPDASTPPTQRSSPIPNARDG